jgi:competence protein ComEA
MRQIAYMLVGVLAGFILAGAIFIVISMPSGKPIALEPSPTKAPIEVHVVGAVVRPGLYSLPEGSRIQDAIDAAGGLLSQTDANSINLAAKVEDGQQLQIGSGAGLAVPAPGGTPKPGSPFTVIATSTPQGGSNPSGDLIDINTASLAELQSLPGIGPTTAQNIINYRNQHGPFQQIEDIMNVPGIGPTTFDAIQDLITVG